MGVCSKIVLCLLPAFFISISCSVIQQRIDQKEDALQYDRKLIWQKSPQPGCAGSLRITRMQFKHDEPSSDRFLLAESPGCLIMMHIYHDPKKGSSGCRSIWVVTGEKEKRLENINRDFVRSETGWNTRFDLSFRENDLPVQIVLYLPPGLEGDPFRPFFAGY